MAYVEIEDEEYRRMLREHKQLLAECDEWEKLYSEFINEYNALKDMDDALMITCDKLLDERVDVVSKCLEIIGLQKRKIEHLSEIIKSSAPLSHEADKSSNDYAE